MDDIKHLELRNTLSSDPAWITPALMSTNINKLVVVEKRLRMRDNSEEMYRKMKMERFLKEYSKEREIQVRFIVE